MPADIPASDLATNNCSFNLMSSNLFQTNYHAICLSTFPAYSKAICSLLVSGFTLCEKESFQQPGSFKTLSLCSRGTFLPVQVLQYFFLQNFRIFVRGYFADLRFLVSNLRATKTVQKYSYAASTIMSDKILPLFQSLHMHPLLVS